MITLAVVSDLHCGSTVGLCPSEVDLDDGGSYKASDAQEWLLLKWEAYWKWVSERVAGDLYLLINGDVFDGDHHGTAQIVSRVKPIQSEIAWQCLQTPLALDPAKIFFTRGTSTHTGKNSGSEESFAAGLRGQGYPVQRCPETGNNTAWKWRLMLEGVLVEAAHHGRMGQRPWTQSNAANLLAAQIFYEHCAGVRSKGEQVNEVDRWPDLALRSHFHREIDSNDAHPVRVIQTPAWQLATEYIHKKHTDSLADVGGLLIHLEDGDSQVYKKIDKPYRSPLWKA